MHNYAFPHAGHHLSRQTQHYWLARILPTKLALRSRNFEQRQKIFFVHNEIRKIQIRNYGAFFHPLAIGDVSAAYGSREHYRWRQWLGATCLMTVPLFAWLYRHATSSRRLWAPTVEINTMVPAIVGKIIGYVDIANQHNFNLTLKHISQRATWCPIFDVTQLSAVIRALNCLQTERHFFVCRTGMLTTSIAVAVKNFSSHL